MREREKSGERDIIFYLWWKATVSLHMWRDTVAFRKNEEAEACLLEQEFLVLLSTIRVGEPLLRLLEML